MLLSVTKKTNRQDAYVHFPEKFLLFVLPGKLAKGNYFTKHQKAWIYK